MLRSHLYMKPSSKSHILVTHCSLNGLAVLWQLQGPHGNYRVGGGGGGSYVALTGMLPCHDSYGMAFCEGVTGALRETRPR